MTAMSDPARMNPKLQDRAIQALPVFRAQDFTVNSGVCFGDDLSFASELVLDDVYELGKSAEPVVLATASRGKHLEVTAKSDVGTPGAKIIIDCTITLMSPDSRIVEALVLVELDDGDAADIYLLPLASMDLLVDYTLVGIDTNNPRRRLAEIACVAFTRGTHITMASGAQVRIEDLKVGDKVLTRDDGPQEIRWIGQNTRRAVGDFAPVLIRKGVLNNENDLVVSADHRLFIYQRDDAIGAGRSEVLVKVRHLINGDGVLRMEGGHVDYFQLLFDNHQIIYAEGIAAESLLVDPRTRPALPKEVDEALSKTLPGHEGAQHLGYEVAEGLLSDDAAEKLRRASAR
ncbi:MAG: Hint domain-containing protein [Pseudomonadota bacterium]